MIKSVKSMYTRLFFLLFVLGLTHSCKNDKTTLSNNDVLEEVRIRLKKEPGVINPFFAPTTIGRTVFQYIFLSLADFHPETLELYPILIKEIPTGYDYTLDDGRQAIAYDIEFNENARWSDGQAVTAEDYLFTITMLKHPLSPAVKWKPYVKNIYTIKIDETDNKKCTVYCNPTYMLSLETVVTSYLMPKHIFDEKSLLDIGKDKTDSIQLAIMDNIQESMSTRKEIIQLGPYRIDNEVTDEYIVLTKKENYWGADYPENPFLQAYPNKLVFRIVPDELTASVMLEDAQLDLVQLVSSEVFINLKDKYQDKFSFHTPQLMFFYYIAINNTSPKLNDKTVRRAMAHLMDVDDIIQTLDKGLGIRTSGPFHPTKSYYNDTLSPIKLNIDKAKTLLNQAGWEDSDGDNIRDKTINGQQTDLSINFYITGSELSKNIALLYQESAAKADVQINIITKSNRLLQREHINVLNYDMAALAQGLDSAPDDPYSSWHSDNALPGRTNKTAYTNPESDALIEKIRQSNSIDERRDHYLKLQEIIYEDQPMIFMYSPLMKFVISNKISATTTSKRPGYLANTFRLRH